MDAIDSILGLTDCNHVQRKQLTVTTWIEEQDAADCDHVVRGVHGIQLTVTTC